MPKLLPPIKYAFKQAGTKTNIYRKPSATHVDTFGRQTVLDYVLAYSNVTALLSTEEPTPSADKDKAGNPALMYRNYYFRLSEVSPQIGDRFQSNGNQWEIYKILSEPALGFAECYCFSTGAAQ